MAAVQHVRNIENGLLIRFVEASFDSHVLSQQEIRI
jgi:hypothetical protein